MEEFLKLHAFTDVQTPKRVQEQPLPAKWGGWGNLQGAMKAPKIPQVLDQILGNSKDKINKQKSQPNRHEVDSLFFFARWWWGVPF